MSRPPDWWVLDLDRDPVPGDAFAIRSMARAWSGLADDAEWAETRVRQLIGDGAIGAWIGEAGDAFRAKTGDLPEQLGQCRASYRLAADALDWWAGRLVTHQADADAALVRGRAARQELEAARAAAASAAAALDAAAWSRVLTDPSLAPTPEQVREARQRHASAQSAASSANAAVADAQARLDAARQLALDAASLRDGDARVAADRIHEASDAGIPDRSRWEKFKDWAAEAWDVVVTIAKVVVAVLGVVALIIGGPLAWVVFAAALLVLADTIMKYMQDQASLWDVAFAALACIPGTKGLTTLSALNNAFRSGGALGAGMHVLVAGRTAVTQLAQTVRTLSSHARTIFVRLGREVGARVSYTAALLRGFRSMSQSDFGVYQTLRHLPDLLSVPIPRDGLTIHRVFGPQLDGNGLPLFKPGKDYPYGSRSMGPSWTPLDPRLAENFRVQAGLPDQNPGSFVVEGSLVDHSLVQEVRLALPLDGNPGGWPEYLIHDAAEAVDLTHVAGVNEPWSTQAGTFVPRAGD